VLDGRDICLEPPNLAVEHEGIEGEVGAVKGCDTLEVGSGRGEMVKDDPLWPAFFARLVAQGDLDLVAVLQDVSLSRTFKDGCAEAELSIFDLKGLDRFSGDAPVTGVPAEEGVDAVSSGIGGTGRRANSPGCSSIVGRVPPGCQQRPSRKGRPGRPHPVCDWTFPADGRSALRTNKCDHP
jgi:hypothetical protein